MVKKLVRLANPIHMKGKLKFLLFSLVVLLLLYPYLEGTKIGLTLLNILFSTVLLSALYAVSYDNSHLKTGLFLGIPAFITNWLNYPSEHVIISHVFALMFYLYVLISILNYLIKAVVITPNVLYGSISVYLLIAITFGAAYSLIEAVTPGSFSILNPQWPQLIYYSFSTMTTLGFGDITAVSSVARSISIIEAVAGQMYLTIIVAKLVALSVKNNSI